MDEVFIQDMILLLAYSRMYVYHINFSWVISGIYIAQWLPVHLICIASVV